MKERFAIGAAGLALTGVLTGTTESYAAVESPPSISCPTNQSDKVLQVKKIKPLDANSIGKPAKFQHTKPYKGIDYYEWRTEKPKVVIHTLVVDLDNPNIELKATPPSKNKRTTSAYGKEMGVEAAINGDLYRIKTDNRPLTLAVGDGKKWPGTKDNRVYSTIQWYKGSNCVEITEKSSIATFKKGMEGAVGGHPILLWNGKIDSFKKDAHPSCGPPQPRTIVGLSEDKSKLFMTVIDGRRPTTWSQGLTCTESAKLMQKFGVYTALNLDGGGSSTMWLKNKGLVNKPSGDPNIPEERRTLRERPVANHLGINVRH